ncbi:signal peptidase I [Dissulfurirhabdus thermomarina]|nr:signal peptidase I [Dissulfurirhabdus thermomarina]
MAFFRGKSGQWSAAGGVFWEYAQAILIALVLALFIRTFVIQAFQIPSGSMERTLLVGDHILVNKFAYGVRNPFTRATWIPGHPPQRGDVIVFVYPLDRDKDYIKRVIGVPGDRVQVINKRVYVNGAPFPDPPGVQYDEGPVLAPRRDNFGPVVVPEGHLFVMGDNRDHSADSRFWGFVPIRDVLGKAVLIYWSCPNPTGVPVLGCFAYMAHNWDDFVSRLHRIGDRIR